MIRKIVAISALAASLSLAVATMPAFAVSPEVRRACEAQAEQVRPALTEAEKEAYVANCLANATVKGK
jgi:hypothetical protein